MEDNSKIEVKTVRTYEINGHKVEFTVEKGENIGTILGVYVDSDPYDGNEIPDESDETIDQEIYSIIMGSELWFLVDLTETQIQTWARENLPSAPKFVELKGLYRLSKGVKAFRIMVPFEDDCLIFFGTEEEARITANNLGNYPGDIKDITGKITIDYRPGY